MNPLKLHISVRIYLHLLATLLSKPSRNSDHSASVAIPGFQISRIQLKPLITRKRSGVWRSTRLNAHQNQSSKRILAGVQSSSGLLQNVFHKTSSVFSWSGNPNVIVPRSAQLSFPPTRVILVSPLITRRCNLCVGVAISLTRPAPLRIAMARPAVASSLISRLRLSTPSPYSFALTSTPCCYKTTPRSRIIETQTNSHSCCLDCCVEFSFGTRETDNRLCCGRRFQEMFLVRILTGTRALPALQTPGKV